MPCPTNYTDIGSFSLAPNWTATKCSWRIFVLSASRSFSVLLVFTVRFFTYRTNHFLSPFCVPCVACLSPFRPPYHSTNSQAILESSVSYLAPRREYCILRKWALATTLSAGRLGLLSLTPVPHRRSCVGRSSPRVFVSTLTSRFTRSQARLGVVAVARPASASLHSSPCELTPVAGTASPACGTSEYLILHFWLRQPHSDQEIVIDPRSFSF